MNTFDSFALNKKIKTESFYPSPLMIFDQKNTLYPSQPINPLSNLRDPANMKVVDSFNTQAVSDNFGLFQNTFILRDNNMPIPTVGFENITISHAFRSNSHEFDEPYLTGTTIFKKVMNEKVTEIEKKGCHFYNLPAANLSLIKDSDYYKTPVDVKHKFIFVGVADYDTTVQKKWKMPIIKINLIGVTEVRNIWEDHGLSKGFTIGFIIKKNPHIHPHFSVLNRNMKMPDAIASKSFQMIPWAGIDYPSIDQLFYLEGSDKKLGEFVKIGVIIDLPTQRNSDFDITTLNSTQKINALSLMRIALANEMQ